VLLKERVKPILKNKLRGTSRWNWQALQGESPGLSRAIHWQDRMNGSSAMKKESILNAVSFAINVLLISSVLLSLFGLAWEYSTRWYLSGFANAVLPFSSSPEKKVATILAWMEQGPARETDYYSDDSQSRDPVDTLNYKELLSVCGTATNAFVNLASAGGIEARRLLLLDAQGLNANHVVAEVYIDGRWVIVDPSFHAILRDSNGRLLTREELAHPDVFADATRSIPGYDQSYNYEHTAFVHFARVPLIGHLLQNKLDFVLPSWQEKINWALLVERQSNATLFAGIALLCFAISLRRAINWYGKKASMNLLGPWEQLSYAGVTLFSAAPEGESQKGLFDAQI
jgi:transglutaminase superfamily protein